jgi:predicted carbohydrate-binding protein with CBM48
MDKDSEMLHRFFDKDLSEAEREAFLQRVRSEPGLRKEFDALSAALRMVEPGPRMAAPASFTRDVMRRLPPRRVPVIVRLRDFLLRGRVLRWNMATALATAAVLIIAVSTVSRHIPVPIGPTALHTAGQEAGVTVRMNFYAPQAKQVSVAGDFNKWQTDALPMSRQEGGVWTIDVTLKPGVYTYMFVVDNKAWVTDPDAETYQDDGFGNKNAVMRVRT